MKPEPDPVAIDLICRLTATCKRFLWSYNKYTCISTCRSCLATMSIDDSPIHHEGCEAIALIIEAMNYYANKETVPFDLINKIASSYYYALADLENHDVLVGEDSYDKIRTLQVWLEKHAHS